jgi:hypothetical protein
MNDHVAKSTALLTHNIPTTFRSTISNCSNYNFPTYNKSLAIAITTFDDFTMHGLTVSFASYKIERHRSTKESRSSLKSLLI